MLEIPFIKEDGYYYPKIPILFINPFTKRDWKEWALIDTGAVTTLFPAHIAMVTGHDLKAAKVIKDVTSGVKGEQIDTWKHTFQVGILNPYNLSETLYLSDKMLIDCVDHDVVPPILGGNDFLINLYVVLNYKQKKIEIDW